MKKNRLDELLHEICAYLAELNEEFLNFEHNKICFGITKKEHKKYFFGKGVKNGN